MDIKIFLKTQLQTKVGEPIPSDFSMSTLSSFKSIENNHDIYRDIDSMKRLCEFLRE